MFSKASEYALRAVIYIAQKSTEDQKLSLPDIAKAIDSPQSFTAKIMQQLTAGEGIVNSVRGPNGGFFMTEKAKKLPVRAILNAMGEGELLDKCVLGLKQCSETKPCPMHADYKNIKKELISLFDRKSIKNLADEFAGGEVYIKSAK